MREYEVRYRDDNETGGFGLYKLHAKDRHDAIRFFRKYTQYSVKPLSARQTKSSKIEQKVLKKAANIEQRLLTELEALEQMIIKATDRVIANPYDGKAIGNYLKLVLAGNSDNRKLREVVTWLVRKVENHNEKFVQRKY